MTRPVYFPDPLPIDFTMIAENGAITAPPRVRWSRLRKFWRKWGWR